MRRSLAILAPVLLLLPTQVQAFTLSVYCGNLPGCGPTTDFTPKLLVKLLVFFDAGIQAFGALFIVIGGVYMILSTFHEEYLSKGKNTIIWATIGIFIGKSASAIVNFVQLEATSVTGPAKDLGLNIIGTLKGTVVDLLYVALLAVALYNGMRMVISRGQEEEFKKARDGLFYAAIGAIIINIADTLVSAIYTL